MANTDTRERLLDAAEQVIRRAASPRDVSVRRIVAEARTNVSSISYHFSSLDGLAIACAARVYRRLNMERLADLQQAVDAARPAPPEAGAVIRALIGVSVRWRLDPDSPYAVLDHLNHLSAHADRPEAYRDMINDVGTHILFVQRLREAAPWFDEAEIRWRLTAALGVRSQFTRQPERSALLTGMAMSGDPEPIIDAMCAVIAPMFMRPPDRPFRATSRPSARGAGGRQQARARVSNAV